MSETFPSAVDVALRAALELVDRAEAFCDAGEILGHSHLMQIDWLRKVDGLPAVYEQAKSRIAPLLPLFAEVTPYGRPIERAGFVGDSVFDLAIQVGEFAEHWRGIAIANLKQKRAESASQINLDDERRSFADIVSQIRRPSGQDWKWIAKALKIEAELAAQPKSGESVVAAAKMPATEQRGTKKRRRRKSTRQRRTLTDRQLEAMKHHADYRGNVAEVGRQMGIGTSAARQHVRAAFKNLNKPVPKKPKTTSHKGDQRGQTDVAKSDDRRG